MFIGTIRNVTIGRGVANLHVLSEGVVVGRGDLKGMIARVAAFETAGAVGFRVADALVTRKEEASDRATADLTRDELLAAHPDNRFIPFEDVAAVRLSHPRFPPIYRLDLEMAGGGRERFEWKRLHNEPTHVADLLRQAVGAKLTTERI